MRELAPPLPDAADDETLIESFHAMVGHPEYPCLGARSVFRRDRASVCVYQELGDACTARALLTDLDGFASDVDLDSDLASFVALFRQPEPEDEEHFERLLWAQLRQVHDADSSPWAPGVSSNPEDPHFGFSAGGVAYFVIGMHPRASRIARRAPVPTLVFNLHAQFERLRSEGTFPRMRDRIRARDARLQGTRNPMVSDHGDGSEARQYSGRAVESTWRAPFAPHHRVAPGHRRETRR